MGGVDPIEFRGFPCGPWVGYSVGPLFFCMSKERKRRRRPVPVLIEGPFNNSFVRVLPMVMDPCDHRGRLTGRPPQSLVSISKLLALKMISPPHSNGSRFRTPVTGDSDRHQGTLQNPAAFNLRERKAWTTLLLPRHRWHRGETIFYY